MDDHPAVRSMLRTVLSLDLGWHLAGETGNGREGVELVSVLQPDAVLMELDLPEVHGWFAIRAMRSVDPLVAIVVLTSEEITPEHRRSLIGRGADAVVEKGLGLAELRATIGRAVALRRPDTSDVM